MSAVVARDSESFRVRSWQAKNAQTLRTVDDTFEELEEAWDCIASAPNPGNIAIQLMPYPHPNPT